MSVFRQLLPDFFIVLSRDEIKKFARKPKCVNSSDIAEELSSVQRSSKTTAHHLVYCVLH